MKPQIGMRLRVAIAQNGILRRRFAATTYGGSGLTGGAGGTAGAPVRGAGPVAAGAAAAVVAGADEAAFAGAVSAGVSGSPPWPIAARRSRDRLRRCSGISVTAPMIDGDRATSRISELDPTPPSPCTYAQPRALDTVWC